MAKKKTRYPNRKKTIIRNTSIAVLVVAILSAGIFTAYWLDRQSKSYILTFNEEKINVDEYKYYLVMHSEDTEGNIPDTALDALKSNLIVNEMARKMGISLTGEETSEINLSAQVFNSYLEATGIPSLKISDKRWVEMYGEDTIAQKIMDELTKDYVLDEDAFKPIFEDYFENGKAEYTETKMKYVVTETAEDAEAAREKLLAGGDADEIIKEYSVAYSEDTEIETVDLRQTGFDAERTEKLMALGVGDISEVIEIVEGESYAVFKIEEINIPTKEELEEDSRANYTTNQKSVIFQEEFAKYVEEATFKTNVKAYNALVQ